MFFRLLAALVTTAIILTIIAAQLPPISAPQLPAPLYDQSSSQQSGTPANVRLKDVTLRWQVLPQHQQTTKALSAITETLGSGVCVLDANRDGWMDLFFVGGSGHTRFFGKKSWWYQKQGNQLLINHSGHFMTNETEQYGLSTSMHGMGCAVSDLDQNGWSDLIVTGVDNNKVYRNNGDNTFSDVTEASGIQDEHWSTGASVGDFNNDGLPDLYISNYIHFRKGAKTFERTKGFALETVAFDASLYDALPNRLYLNQGGFHFKDVTQAAGVADNFGRSLGAKWVDLNQDGWQDLVVINDVGSPNQVYLNHAGQHFTRNEQAFSLLETRASHDLRFFDSNGDGKQDALISRMQGKAPVLAIAQKDNTFVDHVWHTGIGDQQHLNKSVWGIAAADLNNDGFEEIYMASGTVLPDGDSPFVAQGQENLLFVASFETNQGQSYISQPPLDFPQYPLSSRGVISVDLNNDGSLELIVTNNNHALQILRNSAQTAHWIGLDLVTNNPGQRLDGAIVTINTGQHSDQRMLHYNPGYLSQGDHRIHFGLGHHETVESILIRWPDGQQTRQQSLEANHYYTVTKGSSEFQPVSAASTPAIPVETITKISDQFRLAKLLMAIKTPEATERLFALWQHTDTAAKRRILKHLQLQTNWYPAFTWLVQDSLQNTHDTELQSLAIYILRQIELEFSIPWLIPLLQAGTPEIRCLVAKTLEHFYEEEEAVTHRKYLALSPLIRMLEAEAPVAACAADALAAAERKRATLPLMKSFAETDNTAFQAAAIRALGLIRDVRATDTFLQIVSNPQVYPPEVIAAAFVALKRINYNELESRLKAFFVPKAQAGMDLTGIQFSTLAHLVSHPDGIVFKRDVLETYAKPFLTADPDSASRPYLSTGQAEPPILIPSESHMMALLHSIPPDILSLSLAGIHTLRSHAQHEHEQVAKFLNSQPASFRLLINSILQSKSLSDDARLQLLIKAARLDAVIARTLLLPRLESMPTSNLPDAITALAQHPLNPETQEKLWKLARGETTPRSAQVPRSAQLEILNTLLPYDREAVMEYLKHEVFKHGGF